MIRRLGVFGFAGGLLASVIVALTTMGTSPGPLRSAALNKSEAEGQSATATRRTPLRRGGSEPAKPDKPGTATTAED
jgi:hypothetical protein